MKRASMLRIWSVTSRDAHDGGTSLRALRPSTRLRALIKIPDRLKEVLTTEGMIDRGALDVATQNLENRLTDLERRVNAAGPTAFAHRHWNGQGKLCGCLSRDVPRVASEHGIGSAAASG